MIKAIKSPSYVFYHLVIKITKKYPAFLPDSIVLKALFYFEFGYKLNLKHPKTFNEKLQWLKLYQRDPIMTKMVDKYEAKQYVADRIGEEYIIPTLGVWDSFDNIDFEKLPNQFVLKTTHDSGGVVIVRDKSMLDKKEARAEVTTAQNYWKGLGVNSVPTIVFNRKRAVTGAQPVSTFKQILTALIADNR